VLVEVGEMTRLSRHFTHLQTSSPSLAEFVDRPGRRPLRAGAWREAVHPCVQPIRSVSHDHDQRHAVRGALSVVAATAYPLYDRNRRDPLSPARARSMRWFT
jgi:hypothetical protein